VHAKVELGPLRRHEAKGLRKNNRAENSHHGATTRVQDAKVQVARLSSEISVVHAAVHTPFNTQRHLISVKRFASSRSAAFDILGRLPRLRSSWRASASRLRFP